MASESRLPFKAGDTLGADKGYDFESFLEELKRGGIRPHIARNTPNGRAGAFDDRSMNGKRYKMSLQVRKRIEQGFGRVKTVGDLRKLPLRGLEKVSAWAHWNFAAYNLIRIGGLGEWWNPQPT